MTLLMLPGLLAPAAALRLSNPYEPAAEGRFGSPRPNEGLLPTPPLPPQRERARGEGIPAGRGNEGEGRERTVHHVHSLQYRLAVRSPPRGTGINNRSTEEPHDRHQYRI